jgi:hypothetical protein
MQVSAYIAIIITCSIACFWFENDNLYQSYYYNREINNLNARIALQKAKIAKQETENAIAE